MFVVTVAQQFTVTDRVRPGCSFEANVVCAREWFFLRCRQRLPFAVQAIRKIGLVISATADALRFNGQELILFSPFKTICVAAEHGEIFFGGGLSPEVFGDFNARAFFVSHNASSFYLFGAAFGARIFFRGRTLT